MSTARELHHAAMNKLREAESAHEKGKTELYIVLLNEACEIETQAAYSLRDKLQAEPTRSVLFRSAAALALRCQDFKRVEQLVLTALIGNVPYEIKSELLDVFGSALSGNSETIPVLAQIYGGQEYTHALRERSVNIKVASKGLANGTAVRMDHAINTMRNVRASYTSYMGANYRRSFSHQDRSEKFERILRQSMAEELLISDLKHASFGFSIAVDSIMTKDITVGISDWKQKTFEAFKQEVIYFDYNSVESAHEVAQKYTGEELRAVYGPIVSMLQESNGYTVSITNSGFTQVKKVLAPVRKSISSIMVPKIVSQEKDLKLYQALGMAEAGSGIQRDNILNIEEVQYMEFNRTVSTITFGKSSLFFKEPYSFKVLYDAGTFSIESSDFGFRVESTHKDILVRYSEALIDVYRQLHSANPEDLSLDEKEILTRFDNYINMAALA